MDILSQIKQQRDLQLQRELASVARPSFHKALSQEGIRIIGEIKRASPSKGQIALENFDLKTGNSLRGAWGSSFFYLNGRGLFQGR